MDLPPLSYEPRGRKRSRKSHGDYTVACLCPLAVELTPMSAMLDAIHEDLPTHTDHNAYVLGELGEHNVVLVTPPSTGNSNSGIAITQLKHDFPSIRIGLLVGVGGGVPGSDGTNDVRLGDVVVGEPTGRYGGVVQFDMGKHYPNGEFETTGCLNKPPSLLASAVKKTKAQHDREGHQIQTLILDMLRRSPNLVKNFSRPGEKSDRLFMTEYLHSVGDSCQNCDPNKIVRRPMRHDEYPQIHYGTIGSSNAVVKDATQRERLRQKYNVLCVEMEAAGFLDSFPCLVVRGICDYADSHKNKIWQPYAAAVAAAYAKQLLLNVPPLRHHDSHLASHSWSEQDVRPLIARTDTQFSSRSTLLELTTRRTDETTPRSATYETLLKSLTFRRMDARLLNITDAHLKTCTWLYNDKCFTEWNDDTRFGQHHGLLWIKGKPGSGKSTMMKATMQSLQTKRSNESFISYFFNARAPEDLEKSSLGLYRSLAFQILQAHPYVQHHFLQRFMVKESEGFVDEWTIPEIQGFLLCVVDILHDQPINIFIDALDEGDDTDVRQLVAFLEDLTTRARCSGSPLRICLSSRHYPHISIKKGLLLTMEDQQGHADDIGIYVEEKLVDDGSEEMENLRSELCRKSAGVFLWVFLVVPMLNKIYDQGSGATAMNERLKEIPTQLEDLFATMLTKDPDTVEDCTSLLQWVLFAEKPLSPAELYLAIQAASETSNAWNVKLLAEDTILRYLLDRSKGFVEVTKTEPPAVQFIHETVRGFLIQDKGLAQSVRFPGGNVVGWSHDRLKTSCLTYLGPHPTLPRDISYGHFSLDKAGAGILEPNYTFLEYAVQHVFWHANIAEERSCSQKTFLKNLQTDEYNKFVRWRCLHNRLQEHQSRKYTPQVKLLYVLVEQKCLSLVKALLPDKYMLDAPGERYGNALQAACAARSDEIAKFLVESGANVNAKGGEHQHALCAAIEAKSEPIINLLIKHGAKPTADILEERLFTTISRGYYFGVEVLLNLGATLSCKNIYGKTPLCMAACKDSTAMADLFLQRGAGIDDPNSDGETPLMLACHDGNRAMIKFLVDHNAAVNTRSADNTTALMKACMGAHDDVLQTLIKHGADIDAQDMDGNTALMQACHRGYEAVVKVLLAHDADINVRNSHGRSALIIACKKGNESVVRILITHGADVNGQDDDSRTVLMQACPCSEAIIRLLLEHGADINARTQDKRTVLMLACDSGRRAVVQYLIDNKASIDAQDCFGKTALMQACMRNDEAMIRTLLDNNAHFDAQDFNGDNALMQACTKGNEAVLKILLGPGPGKESRLSYGNAALLQACSDDRVEIAKILLGCGVDVNIRPNGEGHQTPLMIACANDNEDMVQILVNKGADIDARDSHGNSALMQACTKGNVAIAKTLLELGRLGMLDRDSVDSGWLSHTSHHNAVFFQACQDGHEATVRTLLDLGAQVNAQNSHGKRALVEACKRGHDSVIRTLIENGVNVNEWDGSFKTALTEACKHGRESVVRILIENNADINIHDGNRLTALDMAVIYKHRSLADLLTAKGARRGRNSQMTFW